MKKKKKKFGLLRNKKSCRSELNERKRRRERNNRETFVLQKIRVDTGSACVLYSVIISSDRYSSPRFQNFFRLDCKTLYRRVRLSDILSDNENSYNTIAAKNKKRDRIAISVVTRNNCNTRDKVGYRFISRINKIRKIKDRIYTHVQNAQMCQENCTT